jgi:tripeptide aminopeptidase
MDTVIDCAGDHVKPQIIENYDGEDILLNQEKNLWMKVSEFPVLKQYAGETLITTDGTTLLGADDKAGIAEIIAMAEYFIGHPEVKHGAIQIAFTPDEEIGRGANLFNIERFGAELGYTVDAGKWGEIEYENFNAASLTVRIHGCNIHPGAAKQKMVHSILIGMEYQSMLPTFENPMYTEQYEGFYHLNEISGNVENTVMHFLIRDHDRAKFEHKKELAREIGDFLNKKYGDGVVEVEIRDSYYNMLEKIEPHMYMIDIVKEAMEKLGVTPICKPSRGGTDGARLSFMGLPCPNLCAGGNNIHGRYEFVSVQAMEKITELLIAVVKKFEERGSVE